MSKKPGNENALKAHDGLFRDGRLVIPLRAKAADESARREHASPKLVQSGDNGVGNILATSHDRKVSSD